MLLSKALSIFEILQDKYGAAYIPQSQEIEFFNMAIGEYLNRLFPDSQGGLANFELDSNVIANIQPLIYTIPVVSMDSNGLASNANINAFLQATTGDPAATYFRVMSVGIIPVSGSRIPVKYASQNKIWAYQRNSFKTPVISSPYYTLVARGLQFYPTDITVAISITVVKNPKVLTVSDLSSQLEFSDYVCYNVISIALKLAGISTRDNEVLEDARLAGLQTSQ